MTREVVEAAHAKGVSVEGELGSLGGIEDGDGSGEVHLDRSRPGRRFVAKTGVDALAVAIGTSHGAYKFTASPTAKCWRWTASRRSTGGCPRRTS